MTLRRDALWVAEKLVCGAPIAVGEPDLTELVRSFRQVSLEAGWVLFSPGRAVEGAWIVRSGSVEISKGSGSSACVISILRAGDVIGDIYLLLQVPPPVTARCTEPTECWFIPADRWRELIALYPPIAVAWACNLAGRLSRSRERIVDLVAGTLLQRLARLLLAESRGAGLRLPQKTIARMLGAQRTSVNKALKHMERQGVVQLGYGTVLVRDRERLERLATAEALDGRGREIDSPYSARGSDPSQAH